MLAFWKLESAEPASLKNRPGLWARGSENALKCDLCLINPPGDRQEKSAAGSVSTRQTSPAPVSIPAAAAFAKKHTSKLLAISAVPMGTGPRRARPLRHSGVQTDSSARRISRYDGGRGEPRYGTRRLTGQVLS